ncbi:MAG: FAD-binding protein [Caldilineales bacterium]|nr:FAD-binding protein [Caldilineales bacterium]
MIQQPRTAEEVRQAVQASDCVMAIGGGTKPALSVAPDPVTRLDMTALSGIVEYDPNEYTFTALAGTPVREVADILAEHDQYLPFDPILVDAGATLGGTIAANASGSGRYRYGGVRDFILGIQFVDGLGRLARSGGKVVKNSAGFDLSKFMVGSLGRYGILTEVSFKVFPRPKAYITLGLQFRGVDEAVAAVLRLATRPFDMDAVDIQPRSDGGARLIMRLGGLEDTLPARVDRLRQFLRKNADMLSDDVITGHEESGFWAGVSAFAWADGGRALAKVVLSPRRIAELESRLALTQRRYASGGHVAWVATDDIGQLHRHLTEMDLPGLLLRGEFASSYLGIHRGQAMLARVKKALDPHNKFPET